MKEIGLKAFEKQDLPACLGVESAAMGKHLYLKDVAEYYTTTKGEFTLALVEDKVVGMGKLTVLFDGSAWLELLRVHPDFQRQGVGAKIYTRYLEQATAFRCPAIRMYTGAKNIPSAALAQKNGLHRGPEFCSMTLNLQNIPWEKEHLQGFCLANGQQAQELLLPMKEQAGGFFSINHTFYAVNPATCKGMAAAGWVYCAGENALVLGARFQPEKVWHIGAIAGDLEKNLRFAIARAAQCGVEQLSFHFPPQNQRLPLLLEQYGFTPDPSNDVVMELNKEG